MNLAQRRAVELQHQKTALLREFAGWRERTQEGQPEEHRHREKHFSQVRRVTSQLEGFIESIEIASDNNASFEVNERAFTRLLGAFRMWDYFRTRFALRDSAWLVDDLVCADELAWECYRPAREKAGEAKQLDTTLLKEPPLVFFSSEASPFAQARGTPYAPEGLKERDINDFGLAVLRLPIPVIGVPWFQLNHLPAAVVIGHEVGHAVEHDFALEPVVESLLAGLDLPLERKKAWLAWRHELFADVYGVLATGPAFVLFLMHYLMAEPEIIQQELLTEPNWGSYPPRFLRMALNLALLKQLGLLEPARSALQALAGHLGVAYNDPQQIWCDTYEFHQMENFQPDVELIAKRLLDGPYPVFGGVSLRQVLNFSQNDLLGARNRADDILLGNKLPEGDPLRRIFAAATLAYYIHPQAYIQQIGHAALIQRVRAAIPKGVRSAGPALSDAQTVQQQAADRTAGANLLNDLFGA